jgi:hypothetical protein
MSLALSELAAEAEILQATGEEPAPAPEPVEPPAEPAPAAAAVLEEVRR